ncbi:hypothetical protein Tco_0622724 [Tanacetum coccineum]
MISLQPRTDEPATSYLPNQQPRTCTFNYQSCHVAASDWPATNDVAATQWQVNDGSIDRSRFNGVGHDGLPADQLRITHRTTPPPDHWGNQPHGISRHLTTIRNATVIRVVGNWVGRVRSRSGLGQCSGNFLGQQLQADPIDYHHLHLLDDSLDSQIFLNSQEDVSLIGLSCHNLLESSLELKSFQSLSSLVLSATQLHLSANLKIQLCAAFRSVVVASFKPFIRNLMSLYTVVVCSGIAQFFIVNNKVN